RSVRPLGRQDHPGVAGRSACHARPSRRTGQGTVPAREQGAPCLALTPGPRTVAHTVARWTAPSTIAALLVVVSPAWAQHLDPRDGAQPGAPPIDQRVHFALGFQGVPGCGERALFEDALRIQMLLLGSTWDPFAPVSPWSLKVRITRS